MNLRDLKQPPKEYTVFPFWFINELADRRTLEEQLREMKRKGVYGFFIHPRRGLEVPPVKEPRVPIPPSGTLFMGLVGARLDRYFTEARKRVEVPYLKEEWWRLVSDILEIAEKEGMLVGIYDELDWPSGTAGMRVCGEPGMQMEYLEPDGRVIRDDNYIDLLKPSPVREFLRLTHEQYWKRFRRLFGRTIRSFFTDEVTLVHHFRMVSAVSPAPWTRGLEAEFRRRYGYPLDAKALWHGTRDAWRVRVDYWKLVTELYTKNYHARLREWCERHGVLYVGHVLAEEPGPLQVRCQGNLFEVLRQMHVPGIDHLTKKQGGCFPRIAASVAHYKGTQRVLCEVFGASGWGLTMGDMYRLVNWLFVNGINMIVPHAFYLSTRGFRKHDYPPSQFYQAPYWAEYGRFAEYVRRCSYLLSQGVHQPEVAVLYPVESFFAHHDFSLLNKYQNAMAAELENLHVLLGCLHLDYELLDERMLLDCRIGRGELRLGQERYSALLIPAASYLPEEVREHLERCMDRRVRLIFTSWLPFLGKCREWSRKVFGLEPRPQMLLAHHKLPWLTLYQWIMPNLEYILMKFPFPSVSRVHLSPQGAVYIRTSSGLTASRANRRLLRKLLGREKPRGRRTEHLRVHRRLVGRQELRFVANIWRDRATLRVQGPAREVDLFTGELREVEGEVRFGPYQARCFLKKVSGSC